MNGVNLPTSFGNGFRNISLKNRLITIGIILFITIFVYNIPNMYNYVKSEYYKTSFKSEIKTILKESELDNVKVELVYKEDSSLCIFDSRIYYNDFDKFEDSEKFNILYKLKNYDNKKKHHCVLFDSRLYSSDGIYEVSFSSLYKNDNIIYEMDS